MALEKTHACGTCTQKITRMQKQKARACTYASYFKVKPRRPNAVYCLRFVKGLGANTFNGNAPRAGRTGHSLDLVDQNQYNVGHAWHEWRPNLRLPGAAYRQVSRGILRLRFYRPRAGAVCDNMLFVHRPEELDPACVFSDERNTRRKQYPNGNRHHVSHVHAWAW